MKQLFRIVLIFGCMFVFGGCVSSQDREQMIMALEYGSPPVHYEQSIKEFLETTLYDASSAKYIFYKPLKCYKEINGTIPWNGYAVPVEINAKNRYGGYTGYSPELFLFDGDKLIEMGYCQAIDEADLFVR